MRCSFLAFCAKFIFVSSVLVNGALAAETAEAEAQTTAFSWDIPPNELALMLKPLTKQDLLAEAEVWRERLKTIAAEKAEAEVAVKRAAAESQQAAPGEPAAPGQAQQAEQAQQAQQGAQAPAVSKEALIQRVNALQEQRMKVVDRFRLVLDELAGKTDEGDADTLAVIKDYRLYIAAVSGINVDVTDAGSAWSVVKGWLISEEGGLRLARNVMVFVLILVAAWFLSRFLSRLVRRALALKEGVSRLLENFLVNITRWVVLGAGIIMALASLEISVAPLLAIVGAAGFVVAFALQDSLSNFASGIMILAFRPFDVGEVVDAGGVSGKVTSMNLVSTTIMTFDNKRMVVPNNKIWNDVITNATGVTTRRVDMEFGIGYDDDIERAQAVLQEIVGNHPKVLDDPAPVIRMNTLADSSVNFICRPWSRTEDYWDVYWDITKAVKQRFDAEGIGIPFPQRDVHLDIEEGQSVDKLIATRPSTPSASANPQPLEPDSGDG